MFVKKSEVKKYLKSKGMRVSEDVFEKLDGVVKEILDRAVENAKNEKKKTVLERHIE